MQLTIRAGASLQSLILLAALSASSVHGQMRTTVLDSLVRGHVYTFTLQDERIDGAGADLIRNAARGAPFVLLGESHHTQAIPEFTVALFRMLQDLNGVQHLAVEEGPALGAALNSALRAGSPAGASAVVERFPNAFHLLNEAELRLFDRIGELSTAADPIWAVNQEFGLAHVYSRLVEIAPSQRARATASELLQRSLQYEGERFARDTAYIVTVATADDFERLRAAFAGTDDEAEWLIEQAALSNAIYEPYSRGRGAHFTEYHRSGTDREDNMKVLFSKMRERHMSNGIRPSVLVKSGHTHLGRGRSTLGLLTFGNYLTELARSEGAHTLHLYVILNWPELADSWFSPLVPFIQPNTNTVIDLRHVEPWVVNRRLGTLDMRLEYLLAGYDMLVVLGDTSQASIAALCTPNFNWYAGQRGCR